MDYYFFIQYFLYLVLEGLIIERFTELTREHISEFFGTQAIFWVTYTLFMWTNQYWPTHFNGANSLPTFSNFSFSFMVLFILLWTDRCLVD